MNRRVIAALVVLVGSLVAVLLVASSTIQRDRRELVDRFRAQHEAQLGEFILEVEDDFEDVGDDLRFAGELLQASASANDRQRELKAFLAVVRQYRVVAVYDATGAPVLELEDGQRPSIDVSRYRDALTETAGRAIGQPQGRFVSSPRAEADATGWMRVFATPLPTAPDGRAQGAVAVLVDTSAFFSRLRILESSDSRVVLLGAYGRSTPATSAPIASRIDAPATSRPVPSFDRVLADMRAGRQGTVLLDDSDARALGVEGGDLIVAYAPISVRGGEHWALATLSSTSAMRTHERAIVLRLGATFALVAVILLLVGAYVLVSSRREVAVRERLKHAEGVAVLHERTERILDHIPTFVMSLDSALRVSFANSPLLRRARTDLAGREFSAAFAGASAETLAETRGLVRAAVSARDVRSKIGWHVALFDEEGLFNLYAVPLGVPDTKQDTEVLLVVEDLTQVQALESQLLRAEKLATIGVLATGMAHEIGTPLGIVRGRAEYVAGKLGADHPQAPGVRVIVEQIDRITRTMRQLLDFARVKPASVRPVDIGPLVRSVVELLRFEADRRGQKVDVRVADDVPPIAADPDQLQQVLINLVMNACDASADGAVVAVRAAADIDERGRPCVRVQVVDHGCGIPEALHHQVFDPFFTTKKRGQGTGLGLTIVAQIVRNHDGTIALDSVPGRGTTVTSTWPQSGEEHHVAA